MRLLVLFVVFLCSEAAAEKKPVTLDVVGQGGRGSFDPGGAPNWAPDGKRFAYLKSKQVMLYDVSAKSERELFSLSALQAVATKALEPERFDWQNRRVRQDSLQWSADGKHILLATEGDIFLWHMDTGKWDQLTATPVIEADPKLSPDGKRVSFRREHDLYVLDIASRKTTRLTSDGRPTLLNAELDWVYPEELDLGTAYWWSPDSKRIAYMQFDTSHEMQYPQVDLRGLRGTLELERYPQAGTANAEVRLGVVSADGGPTRWMDLGEPRDHLLARVHWRPDSSGIAVHRLNRVQNDLQLLLADPADGVARTLLHEKDPAWINITNQFRYLPSGKFLWSSERDGFRHLYVYSGDGKQLSRVTQGSWEVSDVAGVDEAASRVYYVSTEASSLERQLYAIDLDGTAKKRLTQTAGTHAISMSPTHEFYMDTHSSLTSPSRKTLHTNDGAELAVYREADHKLSDEYDLLPTEIVQLKAADGTPLYARMIKPAGFRSGQKYPAIVMVYGGPHAQSVRNAWAGATWDQALAHRGFVIWQMDNRGAAGRGHAFEAALYRRLGEKELADQRDGVRHLISQGFVDPARIGIYGWSYGGFMTLYSLLNAPDLFKAGIAGAPVADWRNYDTIYTERYLGTPAENEEGYRRSSAVTYADKLRAKLLIVHNIEDDNVLFQNSLQMSDALERAGKLFTMMIYPQKSHGVSGPARKHLLELTTDFFETNLK